MEGVLYTHAYGTLIAAHLDPIEKKPLYHFLPGSQSYSVATLGCNFRCGFCQNWEISQRSFRKDAKVSSVQAHGQKAQPEEIVLSALESKAESISYTYTEPTIFFEYARDIGRQAKAKGLANVFVTNGFMTPECLKEAGEFLDAANVDLKFLNEATYKKVCSGSLQPVLDSIRIMKEMGVWVEVTTLVIPGENDSEKELFGIAQFLAKLDKNIPWHISRFHPDYTFTDYEATPGAILGKAYALGKKAGLTYIYAGNISGLADDTFCPGCKKALIKREIFSVLEYNMAKGRCSFCGAEVPGVYQS